MRITSATLPKKFNVAATDDRARDDGVIIGVVAFLQTARVRQRSFETAQVGLRVRLEAH